MIYLTPSIEIEKIEAEDIILTSVTPPTTGGGLGGGNETGWVSDVGTIGGSTGKITIGSTTTGDVSAGDLFGNR